MPLSGVSRHESANPCAAIAEHHLSKLVTCPQAVNQLIRINWLTLFNAAVEPATGALNIVVEIISIWILCSILRDQPSEGGAVVDMFNEFVFRSE